MSTSPITVCVVTPNRRVLPIVQGKLVAMMAAAVHVEAVMGEVLASTTSVNVFRRHACRNCCTVAVVMMMAAAALFPVMGLVRRSTHVLMVSGVGRLSLVCLEIALLFQGLKAKACLLRGGAAATSVM